jgi:hypothetical protein
MVLSFEIAREGEGREGKGKRKKGLRERAIGERKKIHPSPRP